MIEETPLECLSRLGTSGVLWAKEFNKTAVKLGYSEMDEEWLAGWFANAIENCDVIRCNPLRTENEKLHKALEPFARMAADYEDWETEKITMIVLLYHLRDAAAAIRESGDE